MELSPPSIVILKRIWETEFVTWERRKITQKYVWTYDTSYQASRACCLMVSRPQQSELSRYSSP